MKRTKTEYLHEIAEKYRVAGQKWPATAKMIARWAIRNGLWQPQPRSLLSQCAREVADAFRTEHLTDPQGRRVRKMHALRQVGLLPDGAEKQMVFWVDIEDARPEEMRAAFQQRRMQVLGDCRQLKTDVDSFNENNPFGASIQMCFDFTEDLAELEETVEYPGLTV